MIDRNKITLNDRPLFEKYYGRSESSSQNFTNMFLWSGDGNITHALLDGCFALVFQWGPAPIGAAYPVSGEGGGADRERAVRRLCEFLKASGGKACFRNMSPEMKADLERLCPGKFEIVPDRNNFDYVYETADLIALRGKRYHAKRNHVNRFSANYDFKYEEMGQAEAEECKAAFLAWYAEKKDVERIEASEEATFRLLDAFSEFSAYGARGGLIRVGGKPVACSVGEPLTDDMALIHVEFADPLFEGAFNVVNREFCERAWADYRYVNREEDMGLEGLRRAKESYRPCRMIEKYTATLR
jgi:hypothetical protein